MTKPTRKPAAKAGLIAGSTNACEFLQYLMGGREMGVYHGGMAVSRGVYWNPVDGHDVSIKEHGILPGDSSRKYLKVSSAALLFLAPLLGMSFILFLPLFGIGVMLILCAIPVIKISFEIIASAVRICAGLHTRRLVHRWSFSGRSYRRNLQKKEQENKKK